MPDFERQLLTLEDHDSKEQLLHIRCVFDVLSSDPVYDAIFVTVWYDHDRQCGLQSVFDDDGDPLSTHIPFPAVNLLLDALDSRFRILRWVRDYLEETDREEGLIYRSREPIDWDTRAKDQRMDREEEAP
jgi:hypothetical protein